MSNTRHIANLSRFNAASALRNVFLSPLSHSRSHSPLSPSTLRTSPSIFASTSPIKIQTRTIFKRTSTAVPEKRLPRDYEIEAPYIRLKNSEGKLDPPVRTEDVLSRINFKTHYLEIVAWPTRPRVQEQVEEEVKDEEDGEGEWDGEWEERGREIGNVVENGVGNGRGREIGDGFENGRIFGDENHPSNENESTPLEPLEPPEPLYPIARITNKAEALRQRLAAKKSKSKNPSTITKTIEMNWAIDKHDLSHRLGKIKEFLEKGNKVEVILAAKRKGRKATMEEAEDVVRKIRQFVEGVEGARETKKMEGVLGGQGVLCFEGKEKKEKEGEKKGSEDFDADADAGIKEPEKLGTSG